MQSANVPYRYKIQILAEEISRTHRPQEMGCFEMVTITGNASEKEAQAYVDYLQKKYSRKLTSLKIELDGDYANLSYKFEAVPFERIRRITGYLVGTMDNWNDAKTAEEADRVKHSVAETAESFLEAV